MREHMMNLIKRLPSLSLIAVGQSANIKRPHYGRDVSTGSDSAATGVSYPTQTSLANVMVKLASALVASGNDCILYIGTSTTIYPGSAEHTVNGHTLSFGSSGVLDIDGRTTQPPWPGASSSGNTRYPVSCSSTSSSTSASEATTSGGPIKQNSWVYLRQSSELRLE